MPGYGGGCLVTEGSALWGAWSRASAPGGGAWSVGVLSPRLVPGPGGAWSQGVSVPGGVGDISACTEADLHPVNRTTHTCKNITLPQLRCRR